MQSSHTFSIESAVFDERNLVSAGGLVPVLELAEQTGLSRLIGEHVELPSTRVRSGAVNPAGKLTTIIAGMMCAGADSIDDLDVLRHGGMGRLFTGVYAPSTLGSFLRFFTCGHALQLEAAGLGSADRARRGDRRCWRARPTQTYVDVDSLLRRVYGHGKQGASFGHAKVGGYRLRLRPGLSPLVATISTPTGRLPSSPRPGCAAAAQVPAAARRRSSHAGDPHRQGVRRDPAGSWSAPTPRSGPGTVVSPPAARPV